jgi:hypothetical protein
VHAYSAHRTIAPQVFEILGTGGFPLIVHGRIPTYRAREDSHLSCTGGFPLAPQVFEILGTLHRELDDQLFELIKAKTITEYHNRRFQPAYD